MRGEDRLNHADRACVAGARGSEPAAPRTVHETGLSFSFLVELIARILFQGGQLRLVDLARQSRLSAGILENVLGFLRAERLCEVAQRTASHADICYLLTELGRCRADDFMRHSQYAGPAPVSLSAYVDQVGRQSLLDRPLTRERIRAAFQGHVIGKDLLDHLGVAMNSGRTLFMHGPAGSGKTYTAAQLVKVFEGPVFVPYAIAVGSEVIEVFDPLVHTPVVDPERPARPGLERTEQHDERWVLCHRPAVVCGGELAASMLGLEFDEGRGVHTLPAHAKANNGVLIIDDLGRQLVRVRDLLNRWILPMDSRTDYLCLRNGKRFRIPIEVKVIFCTNLAPSEIGDEAFLRRLGYKVYVGALEESDYSAIFRQVCSELDIAFSQADLDHLLRKHRAGDGRPLLASIPREILERVRDCARYQGAQAMLTAASLDWAWDSRFAPDQPPTGARTVHTHSEGAVS
jgi:hypothetical protein